MNRKWQSDASCLISSTSTLFAISIHLAFSIDVSVCWINRKQFHFVPTSSTRRPSNVLRATFAWPTNVWNSLLIVPREMLHCPSSELSWEVVKAS
jgi:hypothetical protein